jgi:hypothetical protein
MPLHSLLSCTSTQERRNGPSPVLQSLNEQSVWLVSRETADPCEIFVLFLVPELSNFRSH